MEIGIDIGTSYSSVAVLEKGKAVPIKPGKETVYSIPSAVYAQEGKLIIGRLAEVNRKKDPTCFKSNFKKNFGTDEPYLLGELRVKPEQIYTEYYKFFKESVERYTGEKVAKAYLTHPAQYGNEKKELLRQAAQYAGLFQVELLQEPVAAGMSFFSDRELKTGETLLVYDFGGGTFDTALLKMEENGLALLGEPMGMACGGTVFDRMLYRDIIGKLPREAEVQEAVKRPKFQWLVMEQTVEIKHLLSSCNTASANIPMGFGDFIECNVTRDEFTQMISAKVKESLDVVKEMLKKTEISIEQVDKVLCVGGTARIPFITEQLEKFAGKPILTSVDPELAVCCGAALGGKIKVEKSSETPEEKPEQKKKLAMDSEEDHIEQNYNMSLKCLEKAAKEGDTYAQCEIGVMYEQGLGVRADLQQAFHWYQKATEGGSAKALRIMGNLYESGRIVDKDEVQAAMWYEKAAEKGDREAKKLLESLQEKNKNKKEQEEDLGILFALAMNHYFGNENCPVDSRKSFEYFEKAAKKGHKEAQYMLGLLYEEGKGCGTSLQEALKWYRKAAERGDAEAQEKMAQKYERGQGVSQDHKEAAKWRTMAAEQGNVRAQNNLGIMYREELGVMQNYPEAVRWFRIAAEQGYLYAQYNLGLAYELGQGTELNYQLAAQWYQKAAEAGNGDAQFRLGRLYFLGNEDLEQDYMEAVKWFKKAAEQGNVSAQNNLGIMYWNGLGVMQNYPEAVRWFRIAAEQGFSDAQYNLGIRYFRGNKYLEQDYMEAAKWFKKGAEAGDRDAQYALGLMYDKGLGMEEDAAQAINWYQKAADAGITDAQCNLGNIYDEGRKGVPKDYYKAVYWYEKAAKQGDANCQYNLGLMYELGTGVSKDKEKAKKWYQKAWRNGQEKAKDRLKCL